MTRFRIAAAAVGAALLFVHPHPAHAESGPFYGSGSTHPGVSLFTGTTPNAVSIDATWITERETFDCSFDGTGTETMVNGAGQGQLACNGPVTSRNCTVDYARVGVVLVWSGRCGLTALSGLLVWLPTNINPVTAFNVQGFVTCCTSI